MLSSMTMLYLRAFRVQKSISQKGWDYNLLAHGLYLLKNIKLINKMQEFYQNATGIQLKQVPFFTCSITIKKINTTKNNWNVGNVKSMETRMNLEQE